MKKKNTFSHPLQIVIARKVYLLIWLLNSVLYKSIVYFYVLGPMPGAGNTKISKTQFLLPIIYSV